MAAKPVILTIDDDPAVRQLTRKAIENMGYTSVEVPSGLDGLSFLEKRNPQLILLDIMMPTVDGFEVLRKIKDHASWRNIPVIMFSAISEEDRVKEALDLGAVDYILKPFRLRSVQEKVEEVLMYGDGSVDSSENASGRVYQPELPEIVMVVTHDDQLEHQIRLLLRQHEIRVLHARGAIEGLRLLGSSTPDLIIVDEALKIFSGIEFAAKVRQHEQWKKIPLIGLEERGNKFSTALSYNTIERDLLKTMRRLWKARRNGKAAHLDQQDIDDSRYRLLLMANSGEFIDWFREEVEDRYQVKAVGNSTDLIGDILSWQPDFVVLNYTDYEEDTFGILQRCQNAVSGMNIPYYLFNNTRKSKVWYPSFKKSGFEEMITYPQPDRELVDILNEQFGVNLLEEQSRDSVVVLRRKPVKNPLAGREVTIRIISLSREGHKRFLLDLRAIDVISFEEVEYLGRICNYQTRYGIRLCIVSTSDRVNATLQSFHETENVEIYSDFHAALRYLQQ